jgi:probable phosphomutase (TIGR03848 family)
MDLLLIRHGENDYTRTGKLAGLAPGVHLNEAGRTQAQALAERLRPAPIKAIYTSPLERAQETALPLASAQKLPLRLCEALQEINVGEWAGRSLKSVARTNLWRDVQYRPSRAQFPGGETFLAAQARAVGAVEQIARDHPRDLVAAVTHADIIKLVVAHYLGQPLDLFQRLVIGTASITLLRLGQGQPALVKLNDTGEPQVIGAWPKTHRRR